MAGALSPAPCPAKGKTRNGIYRAGKPVNAQIRRFPSAPCAFRRISKTHGFTHLTSAAGRVSTTSGRKHCAEARQEDITDNVIFNASTARRCGGNYGRLYCCRGRNDDGKGNAGAREIALFSIWENRGRLFARLFLVVMRGFAPVRNAVRCGSSLPSSSSSSLRS